MNDEEKYNDQNGQSNIEHAGKSGVDAVEYSSSIKERLNDTFKKLSQNLFIGEFQLEVLRAISQLGQKAYGMEIRDFIAQRQDREINTPQIYAALTRLTDLGLVKSYIDQSATAGKRGRPRRIYTLETSGLRMLKMGNDLKPMSLKGTNGAIPTTSKALSSYTP